MLLCGYVALRVYSRLTHLVRCDAVTYVHQWLAALLCYKHQWLALQKDVAEKC